MQAIRLRHWSPFSLCAGLVASSTPNLRSSSFTESSTPRVVHSFDAGGIISSESCVVRLGLQRSLSNQRLVLWVFTVPATA